MWPGIEGSNNLHLIAPLTWGKRLRPVQSIMYYMPYSRSDVEKVLDVAFAIVTLSCLFSHYPMIM